MSAIVDLDLVKHFLHQWFGGLIENIHLALNISLLVLLLNLLCLLVD